MFSAAISDALEDASPEKAAVWRLGSPCPLTWQLAHVLYEECTSGAPRGTLYTETAATLLSMHLVRNLSTVTLLKEIRRGGLPPSRLRRACDYMVSRLGEDVSLQEVAASVELSTGHFSTAFKQSSGVTPHAWMRRQRIDRAKTLLHDANLNLTQIAIILGYANQSSLGVAFKRETGVTPTQWRDRMTTSGHRPDFHSSHESLTRQRDSSPAIGSSNGSGEDR